MNSGGLGYESTLPAHAEGLPAHGKPLPEIEHSPAAPVASENVERGTDWPLLVAFFAPVAAAYAALAYGLYLAAHALL